MSGCSFCLSRDHLIQDCPDAQRFIGVRIPDDADVPSTADDAMQATVLRMHQYRAALRGAIADLHTAGLEPSQATKSLIPDHEFEP